MTASMFATFCISWAALLATASALYRLELLGKRLDLRLRALREELEPTRSQVRAPVVTPQPLGKAAGDDGREVRRRGLRRRLRRARDLRGDHLREARAPEPRDGGGRADGARAAPMAELLFWPALLAYGEAAFAYAGNVRRPGELGPARDLGRSARLAAPDGAARAPGGARRRLPVVDLGRLAEPVRLARRERVPDLGLPGALPAARARASCRSPRRCSCSRGPAAAPAPKDAAATRTLSSCSTSGSCSSRSPGFTLAAALSALYLWQERRLKRRETRHPRPARAVARDARVARRAGGRGRRCPR